MGRIISLAKKGGITMKTKKLLFAFAATALLASCGGGSSQATSSADASTGGDASQSQAASSTGGDASQSQDASSSAPKEEWKAIDEDQANVISQAIVANAKDPSTRWPTAYTFEETIDTDASNTMRTVVYDAENEYFSMGSTYVSDTKNSMETTYHYGVDGKYYLAMDSLRGQTSLKQYSVSSSGMLKQGMAEYAPSTLMLRSFEEVGKTLGTDFRAMIEMPEDKQGVTKDVVEFTYMSKNDLSLSIHVDVDLAYTKEEVNVALQGEMLITFDDGLISEFTTDRTSTKGETTQTMRDERHFAWTVGDLIYPDLSEYTDISIEYYALLRTQLTSSQDYFSTSNLGNVVKVVIDKGDVRSVYEFDAKNMFFHVKAKDNEGWVYQKDGKYYKAHYDAEQEKNVIEEVVYEDAYSEAKETMNSTFMAMADALSSSASMFPSMSNIYKSTDEDLATMLKEQFKGEATIDSSDRKVKFDDLGTFSFNVGVMATVTPTEGEAKDLTFAAAEKFVDGKPTDVKLHVEGFGADMDMNATFSYDFNPVYPA